MDSDVSELEAAIMGMQGIDPPILAVGDGVFFIPPMFWLIKLPSDDLAGCWRELEGQLQNSCHRCDS